MKIYPEGFLRFFCLQLTKKMLLNSMLTSKKVFKKYKKPRFPKIYVF